MTDRDGARPSAGVAHEEPPTNESYRVVFHNVGGSEPDGTPTAIGPWTFQTKMVRDVVEGSIDGRVLNACAGKTRLSHNGEVVRNDLNPDIDADMHVDVIDVDQYLDEYSFDSVVFDPPYDQTQADEHYEGMHDQKRSPSRRKLANLVRPGGIFVELGWNDHSPSRAFEGWFRRELHIYRRGPSYQPVFLTIDERHTRQSKLTGQELVAADGGRHD